ncbi:MAG TPA: hypothetical protein VHC68_02875 [Candidatus Paceibacterota bacterium]|nr:hypothetical protein [Candidatus Paceibacterota bacterium]
MRILIATPLYPPEVAPAAAYAKELARRLSARHEVAVLAHAHLPEELPNVRLVAIDKRRPRLARLFAFTRALRREARGAETAIAINGASVELALLPGIAAPFIFSLADKAAQARGGLLARRARAQARALLREVPPPRPEILPLEPYPAEEIAEYEASWSAHLDTIETILNHAR